MLSKIIKNMIYITVLAGFLHDVNGISEQMQSIVSSMEKSFGVTNRSVTSKNVFLFYSNYIDSFKKQLESIGYVTKEDLEDLLNIIKNSPNKLGLNVGISSLKNAITNIVQKGLDAKKASDTFFKSDFFNDYTYTKGTPGLQNVNIVTDNNNVIYDWYTQSGTGNIEKFATLQSGKNALVVLDKKSEYEWTENAESFVSSYYASLIVGGVLKPNCPEGINLQTISFIPIIIKGDDYNLSTRVNLLHILSRSPTEVLDYSIIFNLKEFFVNLPKIVTFAYDNRDTYYPKGQSTHYGIDTAHSELMSITGPYDASIPYYFNISFWPQGYNNDGDVQNIVINSIDVYGSFKPDMGKLKYVKGSSGYLWKYKPSLHKFTIPTNIITDMQQKEKFKNPIITEIKGSLPGENRSQAAGIKDPPCGAQ